MKKNQVTRRDAIKITAASGLALSINPFNSFSQNQAKKVNPIILENQKPGSTDWQLTRVRPDKSLQRTPYIEGYCSRQSVKAGEKLDIMVSTSEPVKYKLDIYRTGYYGGTGARLVHSFNSLQGFDQGVPEPGEKNIHECDWKVSTSLTIPNDWLSGVYIGKLETLPDSPDKPYWESYIIFTVKDDRPVDILFQCSDNTWQAYNRWPSNFSLYTHPDGVSRPYAAVSFDRPYGRQSQFMSVVNDPLSFGSGEFLSLERPFSFFLEQHGYDVSYCCNCDMVTPDRGLKAKAFLSVGHDEYWDVRQFKSVETMKEKGVSLLFFSANSVCWVSPYSTSKSGNPYGRIYRAGSYGGDKPHAKVREDQDGPFPERGPDEGMLMGNRNVRPVTGGGDWVVVKPEHWMFKGTGMKKGDSIPGLVGWEVQRDAADLKGLEIVAEGTVYSGGVRPAKYQAVIYPGPKKNIVFSASTIFWAQALSAPPGHTLPWSHYSRPHGPDIRVQTITHNLLKKAIS